MIYDLWLMVYGLCSWLMVYGLWCMVYGLWFMVCGLWFMVYGLWFRGLELGSGVGVQGLRLRATARSQNPVLGTSHSGYRGYSKLRTHTGPRVVLCS